MNSRELKLKKIKFLAETFILCSLLILAGVLNSNSLSSDFLSPVFVQAKESIENNNQESKDYFNGMSRDFYYNRLKFSSFVSRIYRDYADREFKKVYLNFHPAIKNEVSAEEYVDAQRQTAEEYRTNISQIRVKNTRELDKIPFEFRKYLDEKNVDLLGVVDIYYFMEHERFGREREDEVDKEVFVCTYEDEIYLLWNPEVLEEDV